MKIPFGIHKGKDLTEIPLRDLAGMQIWLLKRINDVHARRTRSGTTAT